MKILGKKINLLFYCFLMLLINFIFFNTTEVMAATYYISASGGSDSNPGTSSLPWSTFLYSFSRMSGGDSLIVKNGSYNQSLKNPPSGSVGFPTIVKAENNFQAVIDGNGLSDTALQIDNGRHDIIIEGLEFLGGNISGESSVGTIGSSSGGSSIEIPGVDGVTNVQLLRNIFVGREMAELNNYSSTLVISISKNILLEENMVYGKAHKYSIHDFKSDGIILRRNIIRQDPDTLPTGSGQPSGGITLYDTSNSIIENNIIIDAIYNSTTDKASFYIPAHYIGCNNNKILGNISLDNTDFSFKLDAGGDYNSSAIQKGWSCDNGLFENNVAWTYDTNAIGIGIAQADFGPFSKNVTLNHNTIGGQFRRAINLYRDIIGTQIKNSLFLNNGVGINCSSFSYSIPLSNLMYNVTGGFLGGTCTYNQTNVTNNNPLLKYILRVEAGSLAKGVGEGGSDIGATIEKRYNNGVLTSSNLWPFPNEDIIKQKMCIESGVTRGWCGTSKTLTQYIWEYLGNTCPVGYCTASTNNAPSPIINISSISSFVVNFDGSSSFDSDGDTFTYNWNFGDGNISNQISPSHTYSSAGTYTVTLLLDDGTDTDYTTTLVTVPVITDVTPPVGSVIINGGSGYTNNGTVNLTISASDASGVSEMKISNSNNFASAIAETFNTLKSWTLSVTDGLKTVYIWFKDTIGNWNNTSYTDTIILDTINPTISTIVNSAVTSSTANITLTTSESSVSYIKYGLTSSYGSQTLNAGPSTNFNINLNSLLPFTTYHYQIVVTDLAGNITQSADRTLTTIAVSPFPLNDKQINICAGSVKSCTSVVGNPLCSPSNISACWSNDYTTIADYEEIETTCDGKDNDCDGFIDEPAACTTPPPPVCGNHIVEVGEVCDGEVGVSTPCKIISPGRCNNTPKPGTKDCKADCSGWEVCALSSNIHVLDFNTSLSPGFLTHCNEEFYIQWFMNSGSCCEITSCEISTCGSGSTHSIIMPPTFPQQDGLPYGGIPNLCVIGYDSISDRYRPTVSDTIMKYRCWADW